MNLQSAPQRVSRRQPHRGLTLVEMMVATTVTLLLILGLAQAFAMIGTGMETRRSILAMSNQVRGVLNQLEEDLQGVTVPMRPWTERGSAQGYFEYQEGVGNDAAPLLAFNDVSSLFGDVDDRLAFTTRRPSAPFLAQVLLPGPNGVWGGPGDDDGNGIANDMNEAGWPNTDDVVNVESDVAEIIYQVMYEESDPTLTAAEAGAFASRPDPGQSEVSLRRRVLLVRPDLAVGANQLLGAFTVASTSSADLATLSLHIKRFLAKSDMSVRFEFNVPFDNRIYVFANSLGDLSRRENRTAHNPIILESGGTYSLCAPGLPLGALRTYPYPMEVDPRVIAGTSYRSITSMQQRETYPKRDATTAVEQLHYLHYGDQGGETTAISQLLGFDVQAFDPTAAVRIFRGTDGAYGTSGVDDNGDGVADNAAEAGWPATDDSEAMTVQAPVIQKWMTDNPGATLVQLNTQFPVIGTGAFVDLGYARTVGVLGGAASTFSAVPPAMAPTYDTWTMHYEEDGINQNGNYANFAANNLDDNDNNVIDDAAESNMPLIDEGLNGVDDDGVNGVDDPGERETAPPYTAPLRGLQIRVRVYDAKTRQVRQGAVSIDYMPE